MFLLFYMKTGFSTIYVESVSQHIVCARNICIHITKGPEASVLCLHLWSFKTNITHCWTMRVLSRMCSNVHYYLLFIQSNIMNYTVHSLGHFLKVINTVLRFCLWMIPTNESSCRNLAVFIHIKYIVSWSFVIANGLLLMHTIWIEIGNYFNH